MAGQKTHSGLAKFIDTERVAIVAEWETFARSLLPEGTTMTRVALRDHADEILTAIVGDLDASQSGAEQSKKSKGHGHANRMSEMGQLHASLRVESGFDVGQMVSEYRALRATVHRMWEKGGTDPAGVTRFNEAIDEAITEGVKSFTQTTQRFRDQTLGILGHDLRNPLGGIVMGATMLVNAEELSDRSVRVAARVLNSANRMNRMISDLLDLTRTRFGDAIPIERAPVDLEPLFRQVIAEFDGLSAGSLTIKIEGDMKGEWDGDRMTQVFSNLVGNAIQHGAPGKPIRLSARGSRDEVRVEVHNSGPPIPERALPTIFDPVLREAQNQKHGGLGLGLYISSQLVIAHGGTLKVTSTKAGGTTFTARMPRHVPAPSAPHAPAAVKA
jgi:signal transduction histidine kinase